MRLEDTLVADEIPKTLVDCNVEVDAVLGGSLAHKGARVIDCQWEIKRSQLQLHPPSLHLGKIQDLIDEGEKMAAGGEDVLGVLGLFLIQLAEHSLPKTSEKPMMALSGVRSSCDMLARNSDLCRLAASIWRLLSSISRNSRAF